jgi:hypothetical protein
MKIKKIYEKSITRDQINDLMSDIVEYFDPDDDIFENLGVTNGFLTKDMKSMQFNFEFLLIIEPDMLNVLKIFNYLKSFSNKAYYNITAQQVDKEINAVFFSIILNINDYSKIREDIDLKLKGKKYNL